MTKFSYALSNVLELEGVWSKDPDDPGGETVFGISRVYWPNWPGWAVVDEIRAGVSDRGVLFAALRGSDRLARLVEAFYAAEFWNPLRCEELPRLLAGKLFEMAVNIDPRTATKLVQIALAAFDVEIRVDGEIGPKTIAAIVTFPNRATLYDAIQAAHGGFYVGRRRPKYERGWILRALKELDPTEPIGRVVA